MELCKVEYSLQRCPRTSLQLYNVPSQETFQLMQRWRTEQKGAVHVRLFQVKTQDQSTFLVNPKNANNPVMYASTEKELHAILNMFADACETMGLMSNTRQTKESQGNLDTYFMPPSIRIHGEILRDVATSHTFEFISQAGYKETAKRNSPNYFASVRPSIA